MHTEGGRGRRGQVEGAGGRRLLYDVMGEGRPKEEDAGGWV